ncbi:hypothetical protein LY78DRAFT_230227 [Colletotrichum sublineola]|nr:hypothetical protein LY78DRAFT_230227 [Colletotrichum sublineola]
MLLSSRLSVSLPIACLELLLSPSWLYFFFFFLGTGAAWKLKRTSRPISPANPPSHLSTFPLFLRCRSALLCFARRHVETRTLRLKGDHICVQTTSLSQYQLLLADTSRCHRARRPHPTTTNGRQRLQHRLTTTRVVTLFLIQPPHLPFLYLATQSARVVFANYVKDAALLLTTEHS